MAAYRVLFIDPDPATTKFLSQHFELAGFETYAANSSKEGLILAYQHRPHVIVLDPVLPDINLGELLLKLQKDRRVENSKIIAFSSLRNPDEVQKAIDLGFHLYLAKEPQAIQVLTEKVQSAASLAKSSKHVQRRLGTLQNQGEIQSPLENSQIPDKRPGDGKSIVFLSSKGGVGTTSLCVNMAQIYAKMLHKSVVLVDLVLPIGSAASIVGLHDTINLLDAVEAAGDKPLDDFFQTELPQPEDWGFKLLAGSMNPKQSQKLNISRIPEVIEAIRKISDYVIIDLGKSLSKISMPILKSADQVVIVLNLDQATVEQTNAVWKYLQDQGIQKNDVYFLINHSVSREGLKKTEVESILGVTIPLTIPSLGRNFTLSNNLHQPIAEKFPQDAVTLSLRQAAEEIMRIIDRKTGKMEYF